MGYVRTARSKGLPPRVVTFRHTVRNALVPILTITGIQLATILGGVIVVEVVFAWPGLGRLVYNAVAARDYPRHPGRGAADRRAVPAHQPHRGPAVRGGRPEDPAVMTTRRPPRRRQPAVASWRLLAGNPVTVVSADRARRRRVRRGQRPVDRAVRHQRRRRAERAAAARAAHTGSAPTNSAATCCPGCWWPCRRRCGSPW